MDLVDVFTSSDSDEQNRQSSFSDGNRDNISTDIERPSKNKNKTKNIKKKYDPIQQNGVIYHYQNDPQQYKRIRKKIQNRLSARRVRGRKQNAFQNLQQEVQYLRKTNSELQLSNARLQTQNRSLKQQLQFMKGLVKPNQNLSMKSDPIQKYLTPQTLTQNDSSIPSSSDYQSPFMEDQSDWLRIPNRRNSSNNWTMLAVFTLVLAVFVIPSDTSSNTPTVLFQTGQSQANVEVSKSLVESLIEAIRMVFEFLKAGLKYFLIFGYVWVVYKFCQSYMKRKKMKKV